jgi:hypothetical protein
MPDANSLLVRRATCRTGTNRCCCWDIVWLVLVLLLCLLLSSIAVVTRGGLKWEMSEARVEIVQTSIAPSKQSSKLSDCSCRFSYS